jgi:hypothetical protein
MTKFNFIPLAVTTAVLIVALLFNIPLLVDALLASAVAAVLVFGVRSHSTQYVHMALLLFFSYAAEHNTYLSTHPPSLGVTHLIIAGMFFWVCKRPTNRTYQVLGALGGLKALSSLLYYPGVAFDTAYWYYTVLNVLAVAQFTVFIQYAIERRHHDTGDTLMLMPRVTAWKRLISPQRYKRTPSG